MKPIHEMTASPRRDQTSLQESTRFWSPYTFARQACRILVTLNVALGTSAVFAQVSSPPWEPIFEQPAGVAYSVKADSASNLFIAAAMGDASGRGHAVVTRSTDHGATWEIVADLPSQNDAGAPNGSAAAFTEIAAAQLSNGQNHVVAAGRIRRANNASGALSGPWCIVRSRNAGADSANIVWESTDEFVHPTYSQLSSTTFPSGVALDSAGTIYVTGLAEEKIVTVKGKTTTTTIVNHWLVIKSAVKADGSLGWTQIGDFPVPSSKYHDSWNCVPSGIACVGNDVFVIGGGGANGIYWQVRKTSNGGANWAVVDNFLSDQSEPSHPYGIAADSQGNVYVVGSGGRISQNAFADSWIVRKGTAAGTVWTTVDQFRSPNVNAHAYGVAVDRADAVHVTGACWTTSSLRRWVTRKGQLSTVTGLWSWQKTDDFSYTPNASSSGYAIAGDPLGNLFSLGSGTDSSGVVHNWVVRGQLAPAPAP